MTNETPFTLLRSRSKAPHITAEDIAAARERARTYREMRNYVKGYTASAEEIVEAGRIARQEVGPDHFFAAPPQPSRPKLSSADATRLAGEIIAAGRKARGEKP
jgi:hypothetical protein